MVALYFEVGAAFGGAYGPPTLRALRALRTLRTLRALRALRALHALRGGRYWSGA